MTNQRLPAQRWVPDGAMALTGSLALQTKLGISPVSRHPTPELKGCLKQSACRWLPPDPA
jgi:hypothetical protein